MKPATAPPTVLLALPDLPLNSALAAALAGGGEESLLEVSTATSWAELEDALEEHRPKAAVVDLLVGNDSVFPHLDQLISMYKDTQFIVCTRSADTVVVERALLAGAAGIVNHDIGVECLAEVIIATCRDQPWPEHTGTPASTRTASMTLLRPLTPRQRQVFELLRLGWTHPEIAARLVISVKTVEAHVGKVRKAFGLARGMPGPWEHGHRGRKRQGDRGN